MRKSYNVHNNPELRVLSGQGGGGGKGGGRGGGRGGGDVG